MAVTYKPTHAATNYLYSTTCSNSICILRVQYPYAKNNLAYGGVQYLYAKTDLAYEGSILALAGRSDRQCWVHVKKNWFIFLMNTKCSSKQQYCFSGAHISFVAQIWEFLTPWEKVRIVFLCIFGERIHQKPEEINEKSTHKVPSKVPGICQVESTVSIC